MKRKFVLDPASVGRSQNVGRIAVLIAFMACWLSVSNVVAQQDKTQQDESKQDENKPTKRLIEDPLDFSKAPDIPEYDKPTEAEIRDAINKGVDFLLKVQNKDGSWGSHVTKRDFEIYAPIPGAHDAFRSAVTAMCVMALVDTGDTSVEVQAAIQAGEEWMFRELREVKRATGDAIYNVWGHLYSVEALARLSAREGISDEQKEKYKDLIEHQLEMLYRFESIDGGWGYYDFNAQTRKPSGSSISFVNASVLIAMHYAMKVGIQPKQKIIDRAVAATLRQQKKDFTYLYGEYLRKMPMRGINRPGGSLARSQACNLALRLFGDEKITDNVLKVWLTRLYTRNGWLSIGRKLPVPHESWMQVSGYFYYYGHYYAALCIEELKPEERAEYQGMLARIMLNHQEKNGCWWDYPMYNYHQQYGTAYAVMTLQRCLPVK